MLGTLFSFSGRTGRLAYFGVGLIQLVVLILAVVVAINLNPKGVGFPGAQGAGGVLVATILVLTWISIASAVRRLRDIGWPIAVGLICLMFVPFFPGILLGWPGKSHSDYDVDVFSDDPPDPKPTKGGGWLKRPAKEPISADLAWMRPPAKPYVPAAQSQPSYAPPKPTVAPNGARAQFGLRGQAG